MSDSNKKECLTNDRSLSRRRFVQMAGIITASHIFLQNKSFAGAQETIGVKSKESVDLVKRLISADGGGNAQWASKLLENAFDCKKSLLSVRYVEVRQFERLIVKKKPGDLKSWDWTLAIQAAIDMAEANGLVCVLPPGILRITAPLQMGSNSKLYISPQTTVLKDFNSLNTYSGTVMNKGGDAGVYNVVIFGGGVIKSNTGRVGKHVVFFNSSFITVHGLKIRNTYSDWTTKFQNCNHVLIYGNDTDVCSDQVLTDGWHFKGKSNKIVIANNRVRTGDDCIAFTQEVSVVDEIGDIEDVTIVNNVLDTAQSSLIKLHVRAGINAAIRRISVMDSSGESGRINKGGFAFYFSDDALSNNISDIKVLGLTGRCARSGDYFGRIVGCSDIHIENLVVYNPFRGLLVESSSRVSLERLTIADLRGAGLKISSGITIQNVDGFLISNACISGASQHGIQLGSPGKPATNGVVSGGTVFNSASTGIRLTNANGVTVENVTSYGNRNGIVEDVGSYNNRVVSNDVKYNSNTAISVIGLKSEAKGNVGFNGN
ncbi:right-handed parallel beta-helix repeat-containing protein [Pseudomonas izuensis]|uniref:mannuronan 5-epimerase n=1 Tax=Pseudomonas izuensis TaxID=2684212 RepID=A0ABM7RN50_9PSED|nr:right-handed parallel beta-helix repeat-containing protein [Pseudomonas izuensis]BCX67095.1 hypothetical protein LAB08_R17190 [Pseudomonas izuensis]